MPKLLGNASLLVVGLIAGSAFTAYAADSAKPSTHSKAAAAAPAVAPAPVNEPVEYRMLVLSSAQAPTAEHEKDLNQLGADGWKVVAPIYAGGILNSYLMMRTRITK